MADAYQKPVSTIIFFSTSKDDHIKSIETLYEGFKADERCAHRVCFRPIMQNVYQFIGGVVNEETGTMIPIGCHEILYMPVSRAQDIERLERTKNVVLNINCMCFVGDNDKKKYKLKKIIDWFMEETEEIQL